MVFTHRLITLIIIAAILIALGGLYPIFRWIGFIANLAILFAFVADWFFTPPSSQIQARRICEEKLSLGAQNVIKLYFKNRSNMPVSLEVKDDIPHLFDISEDKFSIQLPPGLEEYISYAVIPKKRGDYEFGNINVRYLSRLGLFKRQTKIPQNMRVKVYPNLLELRKYALLTQKGRFSETGSKHSKLYGEGTEFESLRSYMPDDDYRRINWKATSRIGQPISQEYQSQRSQNVTIMLDCGRMMTALVNNMSKLDYAINSALMLGYVCSTKGDKVGLVAFSDNVEAYIPPKSGKQQLYKIIESLYSISPKMVQPDYEKAFTLVKSRFRKRSLIVVFTDLVDIEISRLLTSYLPQLRPHHLVLCINLRDTGLVKVADQIPENVEDIYQKSVAGQLLMEQQSTLNKLNQSGVFILDAAPENLSVAAINRYLELKGKNLI
jgi:uncharacterized protein (DUF58 family)